MTLYTFPITGGCPYDGHIMVLAPNYNQALTRASVELRDMNKQTGHTAYSFTDEKPLARIINETYPTVVHVDTGEE